MSASTDTQTVSQFARLMAHLRTPLYRNGYALVLSSILTSGLGMVYWIVAARRYSTEAVGLNTAAISTMIFLANISQFNLKNALNRFIPTAGKFTKLFVSYTYIISVSAVLAASIIFLLGIDLWAPTLTFLRSSPYLAVVFVLAAMGWCVFVLQDSVLTGLRRATWVPIENLFFALFKIVLLIGFATLLPNIGIFASWVAPLLPILLLINLLLFRRLIPLHMLASKAKTESLKAAHVVSYAAGDYLASLVGIATASLLPLLVISRIGPSANAYFYIAWTIAYSIYLVSNNMGMSFITEAATDPKKTYAYAYRAFVQTFRLIGLLVLVIIIGAPYFLRLFGEDYAAESTTLLRLLCLAALPNMVNSFYISIARVQRRMKAIVVVLTTSAVTTLVLSYILLDIVGITGVGISFLISETILAIILLLTQLHSIWLSHLNLGGLFHRSTILPKLWWRWSRRHHVAAMVESLPEVLSTITSPVNTVPPTDWQVQRVMPTVSDVTVVMVGPRQQEPVAVIKRAQSENAAWHLDHQLKVLTTLYTDPRLSAWHELLPRVLAEGEVSGRRYIVEQMMVGSDATDLCTNPASRAQTIEMAARVINEFHQRTATSITIDEELLQRWVGQPLSLVERVRENHQQISGDDAISRLSAELCGALTGRTLAVSWIHGDFAPGNILTTVDGSSVTGIIDWDLAAPDEIPQLDVLHLLLSTRMLDQQRELGDVVRDLLDSAAWMPYELALLEGAQLSLPGDALDMRTLVLLAWLRHIASMLTKSTRYARHSFWVAKNIEGVLRTV